MLCHNSVLPSHAVPASYWNSHLCSDLPCWLPLSWEKQKIRLWRLQNRDCYHTATSVHPKAVITEQHRPQPHQQWACKDCSLTLACSWGRARRQLFWFTYIVHIHMKLPLWVSPQSLVCVPPAGWSFGQMCWITKADAGRECEIHRRWDELALQRQGRNSEALILFPGSAHSTVHTNAIFKNLCW